MSNTSNHARAAANGGLAGALAMTITQVVGLLLGRPVEEVLLLGLSLTAIGFGGTYGIAFVIGRLAGGRGRPADRGPTT